MDYSHSDEASLVESAMFGDEDAFGELYLRHLDAIFRYIFFRIGVSEDAEDLTEQVFLKAWEALPGYQSVGNPFSSWIYRIAHNMVVDFHRKNSRQLLQLDQTEEVKNIPSTQPGYLEQLIIKEEMESLVNAVAMLPDEQQNLLILRFIQELSHKEVAEIMEKNEGACRMIQHRALSNLSRILKGE
jgi:RNA polymerase sigma-70 factor (ECF subfamily)